jgi:hypothetical protein
MLRHTMYFALAVFCSHAHAGTTTTLESMAEAFAAANAPLRQATFEDVAIGTQAPFTSLGVEIDDIQGGVGDPPEVVGQLAGNHSAMFGGHGSPDRFLAANFGFSAQFPHPVHVSAFAMRSTGCVNGHANRMGWRLYDDDDLLMDSGDMLFDEGCPDATMTVHVGLHSTQPFRRIEFHREDGANFAIDDLQYGPGDGLVGATAAAFQGRYSAGFDDVPAGTSQPIASDDLLITGGAQVADQFFGFDHASVFLGQASPPHMLLTNFGFTVDAPGEVGGIAFHLVSAGCGADHYATVEGFDRHLAPTDSVAFPLSGCGVMQRGVDGLRPSHRLQVKAIRMPGGVVNAVIDDLALASFGIFANGFE